MSTPCRRITFSRAALTCGGPECLRWLYVFLVVGLCTGPAATAGGRSKYAAPGDVALRVELLPRSGTISAREPLLLRMTVKNNTGDEITVFGGNSSIQTTCVQIRNSQRQVVAATPCLQSKPETLEVAMGIQRIEAGAEWVRVWVLSGWYTFSIPDVYTIQVRLYNQDIRTTTLLASAIAQVEVLPFDASHLEARCQEIADSDLPVSARNKALYSVRHDLVLPYLDEEARRTGSPDPIRAMRRIGTPRARKLVEQLATRTDRVGDAARKASTMPLERTLWDVNTY